MKILTPVKAHRAGCLDCQGGRPSLVRKCEDCHCHAFPYRMGKNPNRKGIGRKLSHSSKKSVTEVVVLNDNDPGCVYGRVPCKTQKNSVECEKNGQA